VLYRSKVTEAVREDRANAILHEMAHMWFGDLVTMRWWDDLWLNESFATFMSVLCQVEATRFKNGWVTFANQYKAGARRQDQLPTTHPIAADVPDIQSVYLNFDAITYNKGACVLRQLVAYVGQDSAFPEGKTVLQVLLDAMEELHLDEQEKEVELSIQGGRAGFTASALRMPAATRFSSLV